MNKTLLVIASFLSGVGVGYLVTRKYIQNQADEEIESVVDTFKTRYDKLTDILTDEQKEQLGIYSPSKNTKKEINGIQNNEEKMSREQYDKIIEENGYSGQENDDTLVTDEDDVMPYFDDKLVYIITENEYGEMDFEEKTLILYDDGILADDDDEIVDEPDILLGGCLENFDKSCERLYVRDEENEIDYLILRSEKNYNDIKPEEKD